MPNPSLETQKKALRAAALAQRDALSGEHRTAAAQAIAARGLPSGISSQSIIAGYSPVRSEIDPTPLMQILAAQGGRLALPVVTARDQPLIFRAWNIHDSLQLGAFGILEPLPDADEVIPEIVLVPLAAFDRSGHRIGYGGGYYDRSLARLRAKGEITAIGLGFSVQEIAAISAMPHDVALDYVLTETQLFDCRS